MEVVKISGQLRDAYGKKAAKADRKSGGIPCVLYGGSEIIHFTTKPNDVRHIVYTSAFKTAEIEVNGQVHKAILKDAQFHPVNDKIVHIDFLSIVPGQPIRIEVPVRIVGQSPGVKSGGKLIQMVRKVKVKCLPENMVGDVSLDISNLDLGQTNRVRDAIAQPGVEIMMSPSIPLVLIEIPRALKGDAKK